MDFEQAVEALVEAALEQPMPMASYVLPDWPESDPRWEIFHVRPTWWQIADFPDGVAEAAKRELRRRRAAALRKLLDDGVMRRPQLASALGVSLRELDRELDPDPRTS